jgi:Uncharacterized flavoproteins
MKTDICKGVSLFRYEKNRDDLFEGCWPVKKGVLINGYIVEGSEKTVLIDYVEQGADFIREIEEAGRKLTDIDVLVLNHLEPDHTGGLKKLFEAVPDILVYGTKLATTMVDTLYGHKNSHVVTNGEELSLGDKTLVFYSTPNIHWPETMMTYLKEEKMLFSCDAFGAFGSYSASFDDELSAEDKVLMETETERYYANIVAPFSGFVLKGLAALGSLDIKTICPSHGVVWRKDPSFIVSWYAKLAGYMAGSREKEITLLYASMYGNTLNYVNKLVDLAKEKGIVMHLVRVPDEDYSFALEKAWRSEGLIVASPTYEREMFPSMVHALDLLRRKAVSGRKSFYFGSSLWSGGAAAEYSKYAEAMKLDVIDKIEFRGAGTKADEERIIDAFNRLCESL